MRTMCGPDGSLLEKCIMTTTTDAAGDLDLHNVGRDGAWQEASTYR